MSTLFIVGRVTSAPDAAAATWDFQGVFSTEALAIAACRDHTYFVGPALLDQELPHETEPEWPGARYPITPVQ